MSSNFGIAGSIYLLTGFPVRHSMNKFEGRLLICHAFSFRELAAAAAEAGWSEFGHRRFPVSRQAIWLEREALAPPRENHTLGEATNFRRLPRHGCQSR